MLIFEKLNDITLCRGSELYKELLHLDQAAAIYDAGKCSFSLTEEPMREFMEALFHGLFIDPDREICSALEHSNAYSLYFEDNLGLVTQIDIYSEGYVLMRKREDLFIVQINADIAQQIIDRINK